MSDAPRPDPAGLDRRAVRAAFEAAAARYDRFAALQTTVRERLLERLELAPRDARRVLDLGCGTGGAVRPLLRSARGAELVALDLAPAMVRAARRRRPWFRRVHGVAADCVRLPLADGSVDVAFCSLVLQWLDDPGAAFAELRRVLAPGGLLLFATFGPDTLRELRAAWAAVDGAPHVNRFLDVHDVGDALLRAGLAEPVLDVEVLTTEHRDVRALMLELKGLGAHNAARGRRRGLTGRGALETVERSYPRRADGALAATWEVVYGCAWGPRPAGRGALARGGALAIDALRAELRARRGRG